MFDDCVLKNVVGHVPLNWSKFAAKFLHFLNHHIRVVVTRSQLNPGAKFGLEIPRDYIFYGNSTVTICLKKALEKVDNSLNVKGEKVVKYKHLKSE